MTRLTPKQRLFVAQYLVHLNATKAAMEVYGLKPDSARARGAHLLAKVSVFEAVQAGQRRVVEKFAVDKDMGVSGLAAIAFTNLDDVSPWTEHGSVLIASEDLPLRARSAVRGLRVRRTRRTEGRPKMEKRVVEGVEVEELVQEAWEVEEVEWRMHDKVAALKLLGQHLGVFPRGVKINAEPGSEVNVDARTLNLSALEALTAEELLEAARRMPAEPGE